MQILLIDSPVDMQEILRTISAAKHTYVKFLSANDLGLTGANQAGIYLTKDCWPFFMTEPGKDGENYSSEATTIEWGDSRRTMSVFHWYGQESRSEYRLTRVRDYFHGQEERYLGALFLLMAPPKDGSGGYIQARVLDRDEDIEAVLNFLGVTPAECGRTLRFDLEDRLRPECEEYLREIGDVFPDTNEISRRAQRIFQKLHGSDAKSLENPDAALLRLIDIEYALFRSIERKIYEPLLLRPFDDLESLLSISLEINNRRKSRAGLALENHLRFLFARLRIPHAFGEATEDGKKPDFIFPGAAEYRDANFSSGKLYFLGAKTTCKDRWRQVLNEANRIPVKHLCTLQQGITSAQLREMREAQVVPVIPAEYHSFCKKDDRADLMSVKEFLELVLAANGTTPDLFEQ